MILPPGQSWPVHQRSTIYIRFEALKPNRSLALPALLQHYLKNKTHIIKTLLAIDLDREAGQDVMVILLFPTPRYYRKAGNHQGTSASVRPSSPITSLVQGVTGKPPSDTSQAETLDVVSNEISLPRIEDGKLDWRWTFFGSRLTVSGCCFCTGFRTYMLKLNGV
jgi:hypothetical protein